MPKISVHKTREGAEKTLGKHFQHLCLINHVADHSEILSWDYEKLEREALKVRDTMRPPRREDPNWVFLWSLDYAEVLP